MRKLLFTFLVVLCGTVISIAANVEGKWKSTGGEMEITYVFEMVDGSLTGSIDTPMGALPMSNIVVDGNSISFDLDVMGNVMKSSGTFDDTEMKIKSTGGMSDGQEAILKKVEE